MTCGKTLNESSDLRGFTTVDGPSTFKQDLYLKNPTNENTITLSASTVTEDYVLNLPPVQGTSGQFFTTDGLGNATWSSVTPTVGGVSYIAISPPNGFMTVNGLVSDSTFTNKTFNLELSGILPTTFGGTGLSAVGSNNQILSSNGSSLEWKTSSGTGLNILQTSPTLITPNIGDATGTSLTITGNVGIGITSPNAPLQFSSVVASRKIVLWDNANNDNQFFGFGVNAGTLRYQVAATGDAHIFYAGTSISESNEIFRISGNGNTLTQGTARMNNTAIYLRPGTDVNHGLIWNSTYDGPNIFGFAGGALSSNNAPRLQWSNSGVIVNNLLASQSVHTDSSNNLVSVENSGTGKNILQTGATLLQPIANTLTALGTEPFVLKNGFGIIDTSPLLPIPYSNQDIVISACHALSGSQPNYFSRTGHLCWLYQG